MNRRDFLKSAVAVPALAITPGIMALAPVEYGVVTVLVDDFTLRLLFDGGGNFDAGTYTIVSSGNYGD